MPAKKKTTRRKSTKPPSPAQLRARKAFALAAKARSKASKKKAGRRPVRRNKTIITKPKKVVVINPKNPQRINQTDAILYAMKKIGREHESYIFAYLMERGLSDVEAQRAIQQAKQQIQKKNPKTKATRRKYRNGYLDLVIMGHAKKTPSGWSLGGKTFKQGKGIVPASKRGYYLDLGTGTVFSKKARNPRTWQSLSPAVRKRVLTLVKKYRAGEISNSEVRGLLKNIDAALYRKQHGEAYNENDLYQWAFDVSHLHEAVRPSRQRNVAQGYFDQYGFHPIRSSADYDEGRVGTRTRSKKKKAATARAARTWKDKAETRRRKSTTSRLASRSLSRSAGILKGSGSRRQRKNPITAEQGADIVRMKQYRPYMIVFGALNPTTGEFSIYAKPDRRLMNSLARKGWEIHEAKTGNAKKNPSVKSIRKEFAGTLGKATDAFAPIGTPRNVAKLGKLLFIDTESATIKPTGIVYLCADSKGKLHLCGSKNVPIYSGAAQSFGRVKKLEYETAKPHLYPGQGTIQFWHKMGEESGNQPTLYADGKGGLKFRGGSYRITREGIVD